MLSNSRKQQVIIAETNKSSIARITQDLKNKSLYDFKFAGNGAEIYKITRTYYENPEAIGLIIISEDLPDCQIKDLYKTFSQGEGGVFIPLIVLKKGLSPDCENEELDCQHLVYHLKQAYSPIELQMAVQFFMGLKDQKYQCYQKQERLLTELSEQKIVDAKLHYLVRHDELTGLFNRSSLEQHIQTILNRNSKSNFSQDSVLLFIDIDRFSLFNELEGFDVGDRLLTDVIGLIRNTLNKVGLFARIDSDKFGLFLDNCTIHQAEIWAKKIRTSLDDFGFVNGTIAYNITASIGLSSLKSIRHPRELISQAHQACCMAKTFGGNVVWSYDSDDIVIREKHRDIYWAPIIKEALLNKRFFLVFQPVVKLIDGDISHYEVLIRLRGEDGVVICSGELVPAAERMGLIHDIDLWVVESAIDYLAALPVEQSHICLAINLSSVAFQDLALWSTIKHKLETTGVSAERLTFEITETTVVDNYKQTRLMIHKIRALGCHFALDDFGAGYCSFNYLKTFPVDYVKIDGQFIRNLANDETDQMLVRSMHQIAKKMGKKTIAEFVECPKTISILREIGVDYGQGHIFGDPSEQLLEQGVFQFNDALPDAMLIGNEHQKPTASLVDSEAHFCTMANNAPVLIWSAGSDRLCSYFNKGWLKFTGRTMEQEIGSGWLESVHPEDSKRYMDTYMSSIDARQEFSMEYRLRRFDGQYRWLLAHGVPLYDDQDVFLGYICSCIDITARKFTEEEIKHLAFYDPLTELPNRRLLQERLKHGIETARRDDKQLAILMLDLDRFKAANDSLGHPAGDLLLQQVAARLTARLRDVDMVARLGGDEFIVLLEDITHPDDAARVAKEIIADISKPFKLSESDEVQIGTSIGISLYPQHSDNSELLLDHADAALYHAKDQGCGCFAYFSEDLTIAVHHRIELENRLRQAIQQQELRVFYQPQMDIASGRIVGAEALVRWQDPIEGLIQPPHFIPTAEETNLIVEIGEWVLRETCQQGREWLDSGLPPLILAVNISPYEFRRSDVNALVATVLRDTGFPAGQLELEMTESGLIGNQDNATDILNSLRIQGVRLAIDDFGVGYSSLTHLKRFPLDVLKISKSFIDEIPHNKDDMVIAATIIAMAHTLGFKVLAEGVETPEQLVFLQEKGCDMYQGFIKSPPLPAEEFVELIRNQQLSK